MQTFWFEYKLKLIYFIRNTKNKLCLFYLRNKTKPPSLKMSDDESEVFHDEVEIEDFEFDEETQTYHYPCPCGDL